MNTTTSLQNKQPLALRIPAHLFSWIFHPLFIPVYTIGFLLIYHPTYFSGFSDYDKLKLLITTILNTVFYPAFAVLLMKGLGFINSIFIPTQKERIAPYLSSMIFYFWTAWVYFKFVPQNATAIPSFMTGVFLTTVAALLQNIYFKISMHGMGVGGLIGFFLVIMNSHSMLMTWPLCLALLIGGLVCTSRLIVSDHHPREIYLGLLTGMLCQFAAAIAIM